MERAEIVTEQAGIVIKRSETATEQVETATEQVGTATEPFFSACLSLKLHPWGDGRTLELEGAGGSW